MQPTLQAISPERFQNISGADITFPAVGEYRIVLTGRPRAEATFTPFELSYTTVVAVGSAAAAQTEGTVPTAQTNDVLESPTSPEPILRVMGSIHSDWGSGAGRKRGDRSSGLTTAPPGDQQAPGWRSLVLAN